MSGLLTRALQNVGRQGQVHLQNRAAEEEQARRQQIEGEDREARRRSAALSEALASLNLEKGGIELDRIKNPQPEPLKANVNRGGVSVSGVPLDQLETILGGLPDAGPTTPVRGTPEYLQMLAAEAAARRAAGGGGEPEPRMNFNQALSYIRDRYVVPDPAGGLGTVPYLSPNEEAELAEKYMRGEPLPPIPTATPRRPGSAVLPTESDDPDVRTHVMPPISAAPPAGRDRGSFVTSLLDRVPSPGRGAASATVPTAATGAPPAEAFDLAKRYTRDELRAAGYSDEEIDDLQGM